MDNAGSRQKSSLHLVSALARFSSDLKENLERFITLGDTSGVGTVWACCIICLAHLAALSHLIGQTYPTLGVSMNGLYDLTLEKLESISHEVHIESYSPFDVLTGVRIPPSFVAPNEMGRLPT